MMYFRVLVIGAIAYLIVVFFSVGDGSVALAQDRTTTSPDGSLTMTHNHDSGCSTGNISGTYRTQFGVAGILYEVEGCTQQGDMATFFFIDTEGVERCYGKMIEGWGGRDGNSTEWSVQGVVPGYECSSIGTTFEFDRMR